jgi:hypothetical protein
MIGFRARNRAQAYGTFKVLFNALYQAGGRHCNRQVRKPGIL